MIYEIHSIEPVFKYITIGVFITGTYFVVSLLYRLRKYIFRKRKRINYYQDVSVWSGFTVILPGIAISIGKTLTNLLKDGTFMIISITGFILYLFLSFFILYYVFFRNIDIKKISSAHSSTTFLKDETYLFIKYILMTVVLFLLPSILVFLM